MATRQLRVDEIVRNEKQGINLYTRKTLRFRVVIESAEGGSSESQDVRQIAANEKRQVTQFTPRLGRGSEEDLFPYGDAIDRNEFDESEHPILPPIFAPRLGRRLPWAPSPRLGRQLRGAMRKI